MSKSLYIVLLVILACLSLCFVDGGDFEYVIPSCRNVQCKTNERCVLQEVQCIRSPCYPVPTCVCGDRVCADYEFCDISQTVCVTEPCPVEYTCQDNCVIMDCRGGCVEGTCISPEVEYCGGEICKEYEYCGREPVCPDLSCSEEREVCRDNCDFMRCPGGCKQGQCIPRENDC